MIINADDWGKNSVTTDRILLCYKNDRVTSASAMVFMADSERASRLAFENQMEIGLHLNFTLEFDGKVGSPKLKEHHQSVAAFLSKNKYSALVYNPRLRRQVDYIFNTQYTEFLRLYAHEPTHFDGHQHQHLWMNLIIDKVIPPGAKIRRNHFFFKGERSRFNRFYRILVDKWLLSNYQCTDYFFDLTPLENRQRLHKIVSLAHSAKVELMVHPERPEENSFLMSDHFLQMILSTRTGSYSAV